MNFGSYYTSPRLVNFAYDLLKNNIKEEFETWTLLDNSCGDGEFLRFNGLNRKIGADIDKIAIKNLKIEQKYAVNALNNATRSSYNIKEYEKLIIVGNPPYNDITSQIKKDIKRREFVIDDELKTRDIGISFLRSYVKLSPDYICVLHPLSYLVKPSNFNLLKDFKTHYRLIDCLVVSSNYFTKGTEFPIIIALYEKGSMDFDYVKNFTFKIENGSSFRLNNFDFIGNYLNKYPKKEAKNPAGYFYTMRDINALKRNKTFLKEKCTNAIIIEQEQLPYYHYVNLFKIYTKNIPFWYGNLDVFIDNDFFKKHIEDFVKSSESGLVSKVVDDYFKRIIC
ncbi:MAG: adenine methyltransferase [Wolinella sp.]